MNEQGKVAPKRFLLGTDRRAAELANLRLEQLWAGIVELFAEADRYALATHQAKTASGQLGLALQPRQPLWTAETLEIAEAIRQGKMVIMVPRPEWDDRFDQHYVQMVENLRQRYGGVMQFMPEAVESFQAGQEQFARHAAHHAQHAATASRVAEISIPSTIGQATLHQAIDAYATWVLKDKVRAGETTDWGNVLAAYVLRLKEAHPDLPLSLVDYNVIETMVSYWKRRPIAKKTGRPMAIDTLRSQIKALRMMLKWIHRNPGYKWRLPDDADVAWTIKFDQLQTDDEIAKLQRGVRTFSLEQLVTMYKYATDHERMLLLLGLNTAAAQAEITSLRRDELFLDETPPKVKRVRRKSRVYGESALWPETVAALQWHWSQVEGGKLAITTERGQSLTAQGIANTWAKLEKRIKEDHSKFAWLPFKYLRKTAAQLVRQVSDGEIAGIFLSHGQPVRSDHLADIYTARPFDKVFVANAKAHALLQPMFVAAPLAFAAPRKKGGSNISLGTIDRIQRLRAEGVNAAEIARVVGVGRATVHRHIKAPCCRSSSATNE